MILTCPLCATKYNIADSALGDKGRKVKCVSCGHKWWQNPENEVAVGEPFIAPPQPGESFFFSPPAESAEMEEFGHSLNSREIPLAASNLDDDGEEVFVRRSATSSFIPRAAAAVAEKQPAGALSYGIIAAVVLAVLLGLYFPRARIMALWPSSTHLYRLVRLAPKEIAPGLEIRDARAVLKNSDSGKMMVIDGEIANTGKQTRQVPLLQATQTNNSATIGSWTFPSGVTTVSGGKSAHFTASFPAGGDTGGNIVLTFAGKASTEGKNE